MNAYKKTIMALGIALVTIPQMGNALDAKGDTLANNLKVTYGTTISGSNLSNPNVEFGEWNKFIQESVYPYVVENSSLAGIKDTLLINSLNSLSANSSKLTTQLPTVRGGIFLKGEKQIYEGILIRCVADLKSIKSAIDATSTKLRQEKYYVTSKKNAQEILLMALDRTQQTTEKAIELLINEIQRRKN